MESPLEDVSSFNALAFGMLVILGCLTWSLPRRLAVCPLLVMTSLMPLGQELEIFGLHFFLFRFLLLVGLFRIVVRGELRRLALVGTDKLFIWWVVLSLVFGTLADPSAELFRNRLGIAYNAVGCYFFVRCVTVDLEDIVISVRTLAVLSMPVAAFMLVEKLTAHNLLSVFGGVPEITTIREGHLRCQGAFRHPILAGTYGATQFPLFVALWFYRPEYRRLALLAIISALVIVGTASSSGALMTLFLATIALVLFKWRGYLRLVRWGAVLLILGLTLVMNAPVWYLFSRLSGMTGGTGWHRAFLIDTTIAHFKEWWLFGTTYTGDWGPSGEVVPGNPNMMDITNEYILQGIEGGLLKLVLFIFIIAVSFRTIGRWLNSTTSGLPTAFLAWAAGVSLFAHCVSFTSVTYFDQIVIVWYWLLASICWFSHPVDPAYVQAEVSSGPDAIVI
jgi:hypothetical protein